MNRQRSTGETRSASVRAQARASTSPASSASHKTSASGRRRKPPSTTSSLPSHATSAQSVARWKSFGTSSSVVLRNNVSSRSYKPNSFAPSNNSGRPTRLNHVSANGRGESCVTSKKTPAIATTSAANSIRRNSASRRKLAAGPRASVICCAVPPRRLIPSPTKPRAPIDAEARPRRVCVPASLCVSPLIAPAQPPCLPSRPPRWGTYLKQMLRSRRTAQAGNLAHIRLLGKVWKRQNIFRKHGSNTRDSSHWKGTAHTSKRTPRPSKN